MQDNFQQSSMLHYATATSIDGNGTNEGHCSLTTKVEGEGKFTNIKPRTWFSHHLTGLPELSQIQNFVKLALSVQKL